MLHLLDILGVVVFAASGVLEAGRRRLDIFGAVVVALVSALGGGTLRDMMLQHGPVFWIADPLYVMLVTAAALVTFALAHRFVPPARLLLVADAAGLAVFSVLGVQKALAAGVAPVVALGMGVITGVAGGIIRDILCNEVPLVLRREIYATASLAGGVLFLFLSAVHVPAAISTWVAALAVFSVRLAAIRLRLSLPRVPQAGEKPS